MKTLVFEDHGQDFLEWDIDDDGVVIDCRPFQAWAWNGTVVESARRGSYPRVRSRRRKGTWFLRHRVVEVRKVRKAKARA